MIRNLNKKSMVSGWLVWILIIIAGFLIIFVSVKLMLGGTDKAHADALCKGSVALREKTYTKIDPGVGPFRINIATLGSPLLCKTITLELPEDKNADEEDVKKMFADLIADCWNRYGEGLIEDVFKKGVRGKKCQVCYIVNLRETSNFKDEILSMEFVQYLFETPYKVTSEDDGCKVDGGFCIDSSERDDCSEKFEGIDNTYLLIDKKSDACSKKGYTACCYTDYECWNKGGKCEESNPNVEEYQEYSEWECPSGLKCFIENKNYYSYGDYLQRYGGEGNLIATTGIRPGETYAISFGSPTDKCGWCGWARTIGGIAGGIAGIALVPFTGGTSLGLTFTAVAMTTGATIGTVSGVMVGGAGSEYAEDLLFGDIFEREINTVYLTTWNQIQEEEYCAFIESI